MLLAAPVWEADSAEAEEDAVELVESSAKPERVSKKRVDKIS